MKKVLCFFFFSFIIFNLYSFENMPQNSGCFFKKYAESTSNSKSSYKSAAEADIDGDGNLEGIIYSFNENGTIKSAFILRLKENHFDSIGKISKTDRLNEESFISADFQKINGKTLIVSYFNNSEKAFFELKGNSLNEINFKSFSYTNKRDILNNSNKEIESEDNFYINSLDNFTFYNGEIIFKNSDGYLKEISRNINFNNSYNCFIYPENSKDVVLFFTEAVILGIPREINKLSENRALLNKQILTSISKLKTEKNPYNLFSFKEVYSIRGKIIFQFEFDFDHNRRTVTYFFTLNRRTGNWRIESVSIEKPF